MFTTVANLTALIDRRISYITEARKNNLGDEAYFSEMKSLLHSSLKRLTEISCNEKLIAKYTKRIEELF